MEYFHVDDFESSFHKRAHLFATSGDREAGLVYEERRTIIGIVFESGAPLLPFSLHNDGIPL